MSRAGWFLVGVIVGAFVIVPAGAYMFVRFGGMPHGIRLSGMPGFGNTLTPTEQWQVTGLLAHADNLHSRGE